MLAQSECATFAETVCRLRRAFETSDALSGWTVVSRPTAQRSGSMRETRFCAPERYMRSESFLGISHLPQQE